MTAAKVFAHTLLAGIALFTVATAPRASAEYSTVTRGPNGAAVIVKSDNIPVDAKTQPQSPSREFPNLMTRGSHGAAKIVTNAPEKVSNQHVSVPAVITRGPNGAAAIAQ